MSNLNNAINCLKKLFKEYRKKGLVSVYLWGSIITDEHDPKKSDIDAIGIADSRFTAGDSEIKAKLQKLAPELRDFRLNTLFLSELNGGRIKSRLARLIPLKLLLLDFCNWRYVAGRKFKQTDFKLKPPSLDEAICIRLKFIESNYNLSGFKEEDYGKRQYFCKSLMRLCYYINEKEKGKHPFSYRDLYSKSTVQTKRTIEILLNLKKKQWEIHKFKKELPKLIEFLNEVKKKC